MALKIKAFTLLQDLAYAWWKSSEEWWVWLSGASRDGCQHQPSQWPVRQPQPQGPGGHGVHIGEWPFLEPAHLLHLHQSHKQVHKHTHTYKGAVKTCVPLCARMLQFSAFRLPQQEARQEGKGIGGKIDSDSSNISWNVDLRGLGGKYISFTWRFYFHQSCVAGVFKDLEVNKQWGTPNNFWQMSLYIYSRVIVCYTNRRLEHNLSKEKVL